MATPQNEGFAFVFGTIKSKMEQEESLGIKHF